MEPRTPPRPERATTALSTAPTGPTRSGRRFRSVTSALLALATTAFTLVFVPGPGPAAAEDWATEITLAYSDDALPGQKDFGDLPMPDCGSKNITGHFRLAKWVIRTSRMPGIVTVGDEWDVEVRMQSAWSGPPYQNDGPDPLTVWLGATGPVERVGPTQATYGDAGLLPYDAHFGPGSTGPKSAVGEFGYSYDANSSPTGMDGSDGVNLTMRYRIRATAAGSVAIDSLDLHGKDATPPAGDVDCSVPIGWNWTVLPAQGVTVAGESVKVDATYFGSNPGDRNGGSHEVAIDVLANDDDPNIAGGPGGTDQVRLAGWPVNTLQGGYLDCGPVEPWQIDPGTTPWEDLPTGPCTYQPPQDHSGSDSFTYDVVQKTGRKVKSATVTINVVKNDRPKVLPAQFVVDQNTDEDLSLQGVIGDVNGDPLTCMSQLVEPVSPAVGTVTLGSDCKFHWDNQDDQFSGNVTFGFRACDTHATAKGKGSLGPAVTPAADYHLGWPDDLDASNTRRCEDGTAKITVTQGGVFPPMGVMDVDTVDAGYSGDGIGAYTVDLDVLANDWDPNGPVGPDSVVVSILDHPDPSEGTASVAGGRVRFTPADGFSGPVSFTYRICEDPELQSPPYQGLAYCGVGGVSLDVVGNEAPVANGAAIEVGDGEVVGLDLGVLAHDPDGGAIDCTDVTPSDPAALDSWQWTGACQLELDLAEGQAGSSFQVTYRVCDQHTLSFPAQPAAPYGADGRSPGDTAPRCTEGTIDVTITGEAPNDPDPEVPEDPDPEVPEDPDPEVPEDPEEEDPAPQDPGPQDPGPQNPNPQDPNPQDPNPQDPEDEDPQDDPDQDGDADQGGKPDGEDPDGHEGDGQGEGSGNGQGSVTGTNTGTGTGTGTADDDRSRGEAAVMSAEVGAGSAPLARTGFPIMLPLGMGLALVLVGSSLMIGRRRTA